MKIYKNIGRSTYKTEGGKLEKLNMRLSMYKKTIIQIRDIQYKWKIADRIELGFSLGISPKQSENTPG